MNPLETGEHAERHLWLRWRDEGSLEARDHLIRVYMPFVRMLAARIYGRRGLQGFEFDEYLQFGLLGLMDAMQRFELNRGVAFRTYAGLRIIGSIMSGLEALSDQQGQQAWRRRTYCRGVEIAPLACNQPSSHWLTYAGEVGLGLALGVLLEGTGLLADAEDEAPTPPSQKLELRQLRRRLGQLLLQLEPRQQMILRMHYLQELPFTDIAPRLGVSRSRVSQMHQEALLRLRVVLMTMPARDLAW